MGSVLDCAKDLNKKWKDKTLTPGNLIPKAQFTSMGTLSADYSLYGGIPEGKLIEYAGDSGSGKSLLSCLAMAQYQKKHPDKCCVYVDAEETLVGQIDWFQKMTGLVVDDGTQFMRYDCSGKAAEEIFDDIVELELCDNIGMIVIDSLPMLVTQSDLDNPLTKDNGQRASVAKPLGKFIKRMLPLLTRQQNNLIMINHTRVKGYTFTGAAIYEEPCGYAPKYFSSIIVRFASIKYTKGDTYDLSASKNEGCDGICCTFKITKNRIGSTNRSGGKLIFRYETGVDKLSDLVEVITKYEIAKKVSSITWGLVNPNTGEVYKDKDGNELQFAGKPKLIKYLQENPKFTEEYYKEVYTYITESNTQIDLLSEDEKNFLTAAEKSDNSENTYEKKAIEELEKEEDE